MKVSFKKLLKVESTMLCENPKTNVAAINSRKSRGKFKNLFLVRVITGIKPQNKLWKQFHS